MNTLTKTQVLALFLSTASAQTLTPLTIMRQIGDADDTDLADRSKLKDDEQVSAAQKPNSGLPCDSNKSCTADGEKCARIQSATTVPVTDDAFACVQEVWCGAYGSYGTTGEKGTAFSVTCFEDPAVGADQQTPPDVNAKEGLDAIESVITKNTVNWDNTANLLVSPRFNYFDGWFILEEIDGKLKWVETVYQPLQLCFMTVQCKAALDECCSFYGHGNKSRMCIPSGVDKVAVTKGPITYTPLCIPPDQQPVVPENAQDDIASGDLTKANEQLDSWAAGVLADAKEEIGYDTDACDQACRDQFDADQAAEAEKAKAFKDSLKVIAGYDVKDPKECTGEGEQEVCKYKCDDACKAVFESEYYEWLKATYTTCKDTPKAIACTQAQDLKTELTKTHAAIANDLGKNWNSLDEDEKKAVAKRLAEELDRIDSQIVAKAINDDVKEQGTEGGRCGEGDACNDEGLCCGTMTLQNGQARTGTFCANKTTLKYSIGELQYTHKCASQNAFKIASSIAAAVVAAYYM